MSEFILKEGNFTAVLNVRSHFLHHVRYRNMQGYTGGKPFECSLCMKAFDLSHQLKWHIKVHWGINFLIEISDLGGFVGQVTSNNI
jgi:hypothetical protein